MKWTIPFALVFVSGKTQIYDTNQSTVSTQDGDGAVFEIIMMDGAMGLMAGASIVLMIINIFL